MEVVNRFEINRFEIQVEEFFTMMHKNLREKANRLEVWIPFCGW